jgi:hypothetical protein
VAVRRAQMRWDVMKCGLWGASAKWEVWNKKNAVWSDEISNATFGRAHHCRKKHALTGLPGAWYIQVLRIKKWLIVQSEAISTARVDTTGINYYIYIYIYVCVCYLSFCLSRESLPFFGLNTRYQVFLPQYWKYQIIRKISG